MRAPEPVQPDPFELVPLPIDLRSTDGAVQVSVLKASGLPFVVKGKYDWRAPARVMVARKHYEEAMSVLETAPRAAPFLVRESEGRLGDAGHSALDRPFLVIVGAFFLIWVLYALLKTYF